jgi:imidazolonepropionase-like amidohydrolase
MTGELLIRGVAIVDATRHEPEGPTDVLVRDGRIAAIGGSASAAEHSASKIDGSGMLAAHHERWDLPPEKVVRLAEIRDAAYRSVVIADEAGVAIGSGSDVVGPWQGRRGEEIALKAKALGAHEAIVIATLTNARLFRMEDRIGTVEVGKDADLILVDGDPLDDVGLLATADCIPMVTKGGRVVKDADGRSRAAAVEA